MVHDLDLEFKYKDYNRLFWDKSKNISWGKCKPVISILSPTLRKTGAIPLDFFPCFNQKQIYWNLLLLYRNFLYTVSIILLRMRVTNLWT